MKSILNRISSEIIEKKSLFINYTIPIRSLDHFKQEYQAIKKEHPDANHHCYAYIIGSKQEHQKYYDDGEPSRTAGFPMLEVLLKQDLTDILTVTVRYFGGTKLGAGGLVRAYSKSVSNTLQEAKFSFLKVYQIVEVTIDFDHIGSIEHFLHNDYTLIHTSYDEQVHYHVELIEKDVKRFSSWVQDQTKGSASISILRTIKRYE
ncbi:YigZ family protein [Candidatus Xianfuyuplasma coldseepsis]|uniref:YigZ family protein n=1 Tax=Candidatus Xianfuyuplasma coldseepsis TaxID=2782163 RepID=A0A7L7KRN3_9MOLU|nr:YigZ family protein [Xianfuyuplasma coldseepsis]QMS84458.1 YigZ family protein [Xianfuyuplasma coldseepsis]